MSTPRRRLGFALSTLLVILFLTQPPAAARTAPPVSILTPGAGSALTSPIHLTVELQPGADTAIRVALTNSNNMPISRQLLLVQSDPQNPTLFETWIPFEIQTETADALLTVATLDPFNRPQSLRAIPLTLATGGVEKIKPSEATDDNWLTLTEPLPETSITGGQFQASGTVVPLTGRPIIFELITNWQSKPRGNPSLLN